MSDATADGSTATREKLSKGHVLAEEKVLIE